MTKPNVLVLCTGNSARSQMGEALLRKHAGHAFNVHSAGTEPKGMNPYTVRVLDEIGLDARGQYSKSVHELPAGLHYQYIITVCSHADENCPAPLLAQSNHKLHWDFEDPAAVSGHDAAKLAKFREIRDLIDGQIRRWVEQLVNEGLIPPLQEGGV